jgi:hypothetical protein
VVDVSTPLRIWSLLRDQDAYVRPVAAHFGPRAEIVTDAAWEVDAMTAARPDLVLCVNDWSWEVVRCLDAARAARVPSLVLQDGILEWRCQYENPLFGMGGGAPQHQPVMADKIACIGAQSARQIAAWGNAGKVEVTGMPRLDHLLSRRPEPPRAPGTRLLVMTAKNPGFTPEQLAVTLRSLADLREELARRPELSVSWRVSRNVAEALSIPSTLTRVDSAELADAVEAADAVITTPSTAMLEAMRLSRPVAVLDYHNVPRFVPSAWTISSREQMAPTLAELASPPARKMAYQREVLRDALRGDGPSSPRVADLIAAMAEVGRRARSEQRPLSLPAAMVAAEEGTVEPARLADLYPESPAFAPRSLEELQARLARAEQENAGLKAQLDRTRLGDVLARVGRRVARRGETRRGAK